MGDGGYWEGGGEWLKEDQSPSTQLHAVKGVHRMRTSSNVAIMSCVLTPPCVYFATRVLWAVGLGLLQNNIVPN